MFYYFRARKKLAEAKISGREKNDSLYIQYKTLSSEELETRLKEEHERGKNIDEKTIKFSVTISIAVTILGSAGSVILKSLSEPNLVFYASTFVAASVIYTISGGLLALSALKTLPTYGFGTLFLLKKKESNEVVVSSLVSQEKVNIVRQLRNESAYQCLRNGFLLLLPALLIYSIASVSSHGDLKKKDPLVENPKTTIVEKCVNKQPKTSGK